MEVEYPAAAEICLFTEVPFDSGDRVLWHIENVHKTFDSSNSDFGEGISLQYSVPDKSAPPHSILGITEKTLINFVSENQKVVFSLDVSPSMNVVDTSFQGYDSGYYLIDALVTALRLALENLLHPITGRRFINISVTVLAFGLPGLRGRVLVSEMTLTTSSIIEILEKSKVGINECLKDLSEWISNFGASEMSRAGTRCSRTLSLCESQVCRSNDLEDVLCRSLEEISRSGSIVLITDGVMFHPRRLHFDNILMILNRKDVGVHIIQVGGGYAPWSALGYVSDPDLLRLLVSATPTGIYIQDHHLLGGKHGNFFQKAILFRPSGLPKKSKKKVHMPFPESSYQSSLFARISDSPPAYVSFLETVGGLAKSPETVLNGIPLPAPPFLLRSPRGGTKNREISRFDSDAAASEAEEEGFGAGGGWGEEKLGRTVDDLEISYISPEKVKARPFLYKVYKLPGVSISELIAIRKREGFAVEAYLSAKQGGSQSDLIAHVNSQEFFVRMVLSWGLSMEVVYEIRLTNSDDLEISSDLRVKIHLRMPSGTFFLKFKQAISKEAESTNFQVASKCNFQQLCRQLDSFVDGIFSVDDSLAKRGGSLLRPGNLNSIPKQDWNRWLTVESLYLMVGGQSVEPKNLEISCFVSKALKGWERDGDFIFFKMIETEKKFPGVANNSPSQVMCAGNSAAISKLFGSLVGYKENQSKRAHGWMVVDFREIFDDSVVAIKSIKIGFRGLGPMERQTKITNLSIFLQKFAEIENLTCSLTSVEPDRKFISNQLSTISQLIRWRVEEGWSVVQQNSNLCIFMYKLKTVQDHSKIGQLFNSSVNRLQENIKIPSVSEEDVGFDDDTDYTVADSSETISFGDIPMDSVDDVANDFLIYEVDCLTGSTSLSSDTLPTHIISVLQSEMTTGLVNIDQFLSPNEAIDSIFVRHKESLRIRNPRANQGDISLSLCCHATVRLSPIKMIIKCKSEERILMGHDVVKRSFIFTCPDESFVLNIVNCELNSVVLTVHVL